MVNERLVATVLVLRSQVANTGDLLQVAVLAEVVQRRKRDVRVDWLFAVAIEVGTQTVELAGIGKVEGVVEVV